MLPLLKVPFAVTSESAAKSAPEKARIERPTALNLISISFDRSTRVDRNDLPGHGTVFENRHGHSDDVLDGDFALQWSLRHELRDRVLAHRVGRHDDAGSD